MRPIERALRLQVVLGQVLIVTYALGEGGVYNYLIVFLGSFLAGFHGHALLDDAVARARDALRFRQH